VGADYQAASVVRGQLRWRGDRRAYRGALLGELADRPGLTRALSWRAGRGETPGHRHNAGAVPGDLAVLLADGGDCLSDLAVLVNQPELFGPVASTPTAWRVVERVARDPNGLAGLRAERAHARGAAWRAGGHRGTPPGPRGLPPPAACPGPRGRPRLGGRSAGRRPACARSGSPPPGAAGTSGAACSPEWAGPCPGK
jgi:hypothetical protein